MLVDNLVYLPAAFPAALPVARNAANDGPGTRLAAMAAMASALARDLALPLTEAISFLQSCSRELDRADSVVDVQVGVERARAQTHHALSMIRRMHAFVEHGRVDAGRESLRMMLARVRSSLLSHGELEADLAFTVTDSANWVEADRTLMEHVLSSLILSAFETMRGQDFRRVEIEARRCGGEVEILVRDCGPGVSEEGEASHALLVCKAIVEAHGGRLRVDADHATGGLIRFTLPAAR